MKCQTIEDKIVNSNEEDVIVDVVDNIMSFETTYVIYVRTDDSYYPYNYNLFSRARTKLTIVDIKTSQPPLTHTSMDLITWKAQNNTFIKTS